MRYYVVLHITSLRFELVIGNGIDVFAYEIEEEKPVTIIRIIIMDGAAFYGAQINTLVIAGHELIFVFRQPTLCLCVV